jgi:hypothetical protein
MTRTLFAILVSLILVSCVKQSSLALYAFNEKSNNKAFVITSSDGWGFSTAQVSSELAIMGAFYECEKKNPLSLCELEKVNNKYIFSKEEKNRWKVFYTNEKNNYVFIDETVAHKDPSKNQLAKQKEEERIAKLSNNKDWKIVKARDEFRGTTFSYISSNAIKPSIPLKFPYNDLTARIIVYCNDYSGDVHLFFSSSPNLIDGRYTSFGSQLYTVEARLDNKFETVYGEIKNDSRNNLIISSKNRIQTSKDVVFQIKHYAGTTNYNFNLSNFPESCN